jgi:hypothetical protein
MASGFSVTLPEELGEISRGNRLRLPARLVLLRTLLPPALAGVPFMTLCGGKCSDLRHRLS